MKSVPVASLLNDVAGWSIRGNPDTHVHSITFDSRSVEPGSMFVALRGGYADGHDYLLAARERGAIAALVEPDTSAELLQGFEVVVCRKNTRQALAPVAAAFFEHPGRELTVIGVTGTDGKTSTCWYIHQMLEHLGIAAGLISTVSIKVPGQPERSSQRQTTPESLDVQRTLREIADAGGQVAIVETTSHALETYRVDACPFDVGVITNVTREHLDFHGTVENYRRAKGGLLRRVAQALQEGGRGVVVLNADDEGTRAIAHDAGDAEILWYSIQDSAAAIHAANVVTSADASSFDLTIAGQQWPTRFPLPGSWNVSNVLAATGALIASGADPAGVARVIETLRPVPGRLARVDAGQDFAVLVDYAHTPESLRSVLKEVRGLTDGRVLVAFGSAGERDIEKRALQGAIAAELADYSVFTSEDPRFEDPSSIIDAIARGAEERGARRGIDFDCIEDRREAIAALLSAAKPGDIVLLAGKGHEKSMIYNAEHRPWDEEQVARDLLAQLGFGRMEDKGTQD